MKKNRSSLDQVIEEWGRGAEEAIKAAQANTFEENLAQARHNSSSRIIYFLQTGPPIHIPRRLYSIKKAGKAGYRYAKTEGSISEYTAQAIARLGTGKNYARRRQGGAGDDAAVPSPQAP